jgi:hypothetical protein
MTRTCVDARNYGDSHIKQVSVPLTSSCLRAARACRCSQLESGLHHQHAAQP